MMQLHVPLSPRRRADAARALAPLFLLAAACAPGPATMAPAPAGAAPATGVADSWVREVAPFPVADEAGRAYDEPFLGGFDVPRPHFVDIDGDGDLDLFVQERSNELTFFENIGTATAPRFTWRTDRFQELEIGEWSRFVDMDADGDYDVLAEELYSYIRFYRNDGTPQQPRFVLAADTLRDADDVPIFSDRQNIPSITDLDCDGLVDLFLGRIDGTVARLEEASRDAQGVVRFRLLTERFEGIEIIGQAIGGSRHGANSMAFADVDEDGALDFFWGDFFEPGVLYVRNTGTCVQPNLRSEPRPLVTATGDTILTSGFNMPALADIDGDGDLDLFLGVLGGAFNPIRTSVENFHFYEHTAAGQWHLRTTRFLHTMDIGNETAPAFADIDGDGDLDMVVGNKIDPLTLQFGRLYIFRNEGGARAPRFRLADTLDLAPAYHYAPALADLNGDGLVDMLLGTWNQNVLFFENRGTRQRPEWVQDTARSIRIPRGSNTAPALVDSDGDGDLDLFIGESDGTLNFFRNVGSATHAVFELVAESFQNIDVGRRSAPRFFDADGDGDHDLLIGTDEPRAVFYRNVGSATEPRFQEEPWEAAMPAMGTPTFVDLDGDGRLELVTGTVSGGLLYFRPADR